MDTSARQVSMSKLGDEDVSKLVERYGNSQSPLWGLKMANYFYKFAKNDTKWCLLEEQYKHPSRQQNQGEGKYEAHKAAMTTLWDSFLKPLCKDAPDPSVLHLDTFLSGQSDLITNNKKEVVRRIKIVTDTLLNMWDFNKDGVLQPEEHRAFQLTQGMKEEFIDEKFRAMDSNSDGLITPDEFHSAAVLFFTSLEPSKGDTFFGHLVPMEAMLGK